MKKHKLFYKLTAAALGAVMISASALPAFAVGNMPKGYIVDSIREGSVEFQNKNADMLYYAYSEILNYKTRIDISKYRIPYTGESYQAIYDALVGIFPELFHIDLNSVKSPTYYFSSGEYFMKELVLDYGTSEADVKNMIARFRDKADEYLAMLDDGMDEFTKALVLHDALVLNNRYQIRSPGSSVVDSTAYTFMVEGWGRCENYTEVYAYLLAHAGIESEIVSSSGMGHEWLRIHLDGSDCYYNVDVTWDDPLTGGVDVPGRAFHSYFLLSDSMVQDSEHEHYGYAYSNPSDGAYDNMTNLHGNVNPFMYYDGKLYNIYTKDNKGVIAIYDHNTDSYTDLYTIDDVWYTGSGGWWVGNFSNAGMYDGLIYFNRENSIDIYDPSTGTTETYIPNALNDGRKLYGMYISNGQIYGRASTSPNEASQSVLLGACRENKPQPILGDVNLDGVLDISDATLIQCFIAELKDPTEEQRALGDFNKDGEIDISDATDIQLAISK